MVKEIDGIISKVKVQTHPKNRTVIGKCPPPCCICLCCCCMIMWSTSSSGCPRLFPGSCVSLGDAGAGVACCIAACTIGFIADAIADVVIGLVSSGLRGENGDRDLCGCW